MIIVGRLILFLLRFAVAALFLFAAYQKLFAPESGPQKFALAINSFDILPAHLVLLATGAIPWIEVICGVFLILGLWTRASATVLALMLFCFTIAVASVLMRKMSVSCGCFGNMTLLCDHEKLNWCKVLENTLIFIPTALVAAFGGGYLELDRIGCKTGAGNPSGATGSPSPSKG